ncbi:MAG: type 4a pilus biogenesis protein PilO [Candidatus Marinimicrobia bacterium]|nr:type 4a pilus biogenesis protein PilO [Candidatus Neomarinimicrobiota bacterium]
MITVLLLSTGWWGWSDLWKNGSYIRQKEKELRNLEMKFNKLSDVKDSYSIVKEKYGTCLVEFDSLTGKIPDRDSFVNVFEDIRKIAEKQNIQIKSFSPILEDSYPAIKYKLKKTGKHIERYPIQIQLLGNYLTIGAFLEEIISLPTVVNIRSIGLETELESGGVLTCELVLYAYMVLDEVKKSA